MRLGGNSTKSHIVRKLSFNSSLVRLGAMVDLLVLGSLFCFNSSLVRLGVFDRRGVAKDRSMFQFQLGAIGRNQPKPSGFYDI